MNSTHSIEGVKVVQSFHAVCTLEGERAKPTSQVFPVAAGMIKQCIEKTEAIDGCGV